MKAQYEIVGMTCNHCVKTVENEFKKEGIAAKADISTNSVEVDTSLDSLTFNKLKIALEESGYELGNKI
jgi:copper chaperone